MIDWDNMSSRKKDDEEEEKQSHIDWDNLYTNRNKKIKNTTYDEKEIKSNIDKILNSSTSNTLKSTEQTENVELKRLKKADSDSITLNQNSLPIIRPEEKQENTEKNKTKTNQSSKLKAGSITVNQNSNNKRATGTQTIGNISSTALATPEETKNIEEYNKEDENKPSIFQVSNWLQKGEFKDGYQFGDLTKTLLGTGTDITQDLASGFLSIGESVLDIGAEMVAGIQEMVGYKESATNTRNFASIDLSENISSVGANASSIGILYNIVNGTPEKIFNPAGIEYDKDKSFLENYGNGLKTAYIDNRGKEDYEKSSVSGKILDNAVKMVGYSAGMLVGGQGLTNATGIKSIGNSKFGASLSGGNIGINIAGHTLNLPTLSIVGGMSEGLQEANTKENVSLAERWTKGISSGIIEGFTEGFFGTLGIGGSDITDKIKSKIMDKFSSRAGKMLAQLGVEATGEATEEFLSYALNYLVDNNIIDQIGEADFSSEWNWEDVFEQMAIAFVSTSISAGVGITVSNNIGTKSAEEQLGRKLTQEEKAQVTQALAEDALQQKVVELENSDRPASVINQMQDFYVASYNQNGEIENIISSKGMTIDSPNSKVNVSPAIIKNNKLEDSYNVIDSNTGLLLDSTPYTTIIAAKAGFNKKMINLNEVSINSINNKVVQAKLELDTRIGQAVAQSQQRINNTTQSSQNQFSDNLDVETTNYASKNENGVTGQNNTQAKNSDTGSFNLKQNQLEIINKSNPMQDDYHTGIRSVEDIKTFEETLQDSDWADYNEFNPDYTRDMANQAIETGKITVYSSYPIKQGVFVAPSQMEAESYSGNGKIYSKEVSLTDVAWIDPTQGQYAKVSNKKSKSSTFYSNTEQYRVDNMDNAMSFYQNNKKYNVNEVEDIYNNKIEEADGDIVIRTNNGDNYIDIVKKDNNTISIKEYADTLPTSELINSIDIKTTDGKVSGKQINEAIKELTKIQNENKPIKGQVDIEGNEIRSMKKKNTNNKSDAEIRNIVKYNNDGREIKDSYYVDFMVERYKDNKNISGVVTDTKKISKLLGEDISKNNKLKELYSEIDDTDDIQLKIKLKNENTQQLEDVDLNIDITMSGIRESFSKSNNIEKYAVVPYLDKLIKTVKNGNGYFKMSDDKQRENVKGYFYLFNTAEIDKKLYSVKMDIRRTEMGDKFYVHRVSLIKNEETSIQASDLSKSYELVGQEVSSIDNSISQQNKNVKDDTNINSKSMQNSENNTRSMKKSGLAQEYDSQGNKLSKAQADYFKDSKVRDENGNLMVMYHGTEANVGIPEEFWFTVFDINKSGRNGNLLGDGFYFTSDKGHASEYAHTKGNIYEVYLNIKKPLKLPTDDFEKRRAILNEIEKKANNEHMYISSYLKSLGYDGIHSGNTYIAFNSNQIKNIDNTNPTSNDDIRYMKKSNTKQKNDINKDIETFSKAKDTVNREVVSNIAENLNIPIKKGSVKIVDTNMAKRAGQNKNPKIITITEAFKNVTDENAKDFRNDAIDMAMELFRDTEVTIIDTDSIAEVNKKGIEKTFSNRVSATKIQTANDILNIIEQGIYGYTTQSLADKNTILYHHFFTPVTYNGNNGLIRVVIKEYPKDIKQKNKFYYHQLEYIDNKKIEGSWDALHQKLEVRHIKSSPSINNNISQNSKNINSNTAKKTSDIEPGLTNAERADAWIEQEIQKVEKDGSWDTSIPVTKRTDIRKTIEDYLGIGIQRGHFRQRAYAIYNGGTDNIRTKELKDIDSILHETGHALDLGNRIKLDKESIADELLVAISKLGGYENETRAVKLEEGFAEIIREYAIIPEQAKIDYPQTVAVLKGIQQADNNFNNFITKVQQQVYNYIHQTPYNRELSNQSVGERTDRVPITKDNIKEKVVKTVWDKDYALKSAVEEIAKSGGKNASDIPLSQNAYILSRLASGVHTKAVSMISDGYIDENGNQLMPGLNKLGDILGNSEERFNDLRAYLLAQRDLEYKQKTLKTGIRTSDAKAVIEQFKNDTQIQRAAKIIYDTCDGVLQYAVNNGLITEETAETLRKDNAFYVPFYRVLDTDRGNQIGRYGSVAEIIKTRKGSELDIKDVLENVVVNASNTIQQVENNNVLRALYNESKQVGLKNHLFTKIPAPMTHVGTASLTTWKTELEKQGVDTSNIDLEKTIDIFAPSNKTDQRNLITSFINEDGKRIYLQFAEGTNDLFNSIMGTNSKMMSDILKINSKLNMPLRYGATMANIGFAIPNMISDTAQAAIYSEAGFIPVVDNAIGVLDILTATNKTVRKFMEKNCPEYATRINRMYAIYEQTGASNSTRLSQYRKSTQEIMSDIYGTKNSEVLGIDEKFRPLKRLLDIMTYIPELSEQSTRFRVFERNYNLALSKGNSELDARIKGAIESRDATQDFGRTGNLTREINQLIPFSAARVGSAYTFAEKIKARPKQTSMRIAVLVVIAMAIKGIGYDDKEIEELNQRKKDDNFVLKIGDRVVTIKKPQGILRSIINLTEYIQDLVTGHIEEGKEGDRLVDWVKNAIMDNMPADEVTGLVPNAITPLIENAINKDLYYNTEIVKSYDEDLPDYMQYYDYTSQVAIWLGKAFRYIPGFGDDGYSPAKIDNLISGWFGGLGTQITDAIDYVSGKLGLSAEEPEMGAEDNAVGKRFIVNVNENSASLDEVYELKTELTKKKNGGTITEEEEQQLETLTEAISSISAINKQIKAIKSDLTTSGEEKAEQIRPLQEQKTDIARQALGKELINEDNAESIEATKFYPSRSTLSQSGYTLELTEEMKKEYETLAYEKYKQYAKQGLYSDEKLEELESKCKEYAKNEIMQKYRSQLVKSK